MKNNLEITKIQRMTVRYKEKFFMKRGQDLLYQAKVLKSDPNYNVEKMAENAKEY